MSMSRKREWGKRDGVVGMRERYIEAIFNLLICMDACMRVCLSQFLIYSSIIAHLLNGKIKEIKEKKYCMEILNYYIEASVEQNSSAKTFGNFRRVTIGMLLHTI